MDRHLTDPEYGPFLGGTRGENGATCHPGSIAGRGKGKGKGMGTGMGTGTGRARAWVKARARAFVNRSWL